MNIPDDSKIKEKLKELEAKLYQTTPIIKEDSPLFSLVTNLQKNLQQLSTIWRIALIVAGVLILFSILTIILKLVSTFVSVALLFVLIYLGYRFFLSASSPSTKE